MARFPGAPVALLLVGMLASTGCIGAITDPGATLGDAPTSEQETPAAENREAHASDNDSEEIVVLSLGVGLTQQSRSTVTLTEIGAQGLPEGPVGFVPRATAVQPGQQATVAALAVPAGTEVAPFTLTLSLTDGLGPAELTLEVGPWTADVEGFQLVELAMPELGQVEVRGSQGPADVDAGTGTSVPQYGYIAWPNGGKQPLADFRHVVHVPLAYPKLEAGTTASFRVEAQATQTTWTLDGGQGQPGSTFETEVVPGEHTLALQVGSQELTLTYRANDHEEIRDQLVAGTPSVTTPVEGVNGNSHPLTIYEGNDRSVLYLRPAGNATFEGDLDLYLADEDGQWIAKAAAPGTSYERLEIRTPLAPGDYTVWIYGREGVGMEYVITTFVIY